MNISFQTNFHVVLLIWVEKSTVMLPKQQLLLTLQTRAFEFVENGDYVKWPRQRWKAWCILV